MAIDLEKYQRILMRYSHTPTVYSDDELEAVLEKKTTNLSFGELQFLLMRLPFIEVLSFCSVILEYVDRKKDGYVELCESFLIYISNYRDDFKTLKILDETLIVISEIFWSWIAEYSTKSIHREYGDKSLIIEYSVNGFLDRDGFLEKLIEFDFYIGDSKMFDNIWIKWIHDHRSETRSGHLLDLLYQSTVSEFDLETLYTNQYITSAREDKQLLESHWEVCNKLLNKVCPQQYVDEIKLLVETAPDKHRPDKNRI